MIDILESNVWVYFEIFSTVSIKSLVGRWGGNVVDKSIVIILNDEDFFYIICIKKSHVWYYVWFWALNDLIAGCIRSAKSSRVSRRSASRFCLIYWSINSFSSIVHPLSSIR